MKTSLRSLSALALLLLLAALPAAAGGSYEELLERNLRQIGGDAALIFGAF